MGSKISSVHWFGSYFWSGQVGFLGPSYVLLGTFPLNLFHLFLFLKAFSCPRVSHPVCFYTCLGESRSRREIQSILVLEGAGRQHPWFSQTYKILIKSCSGIKGILVSKSDRVIFCHKAASASSDAWSSPRRVVVYQHDSYQRVTERSVSERSAAAS